MSSDMQSRTNASTGERPAATPRTTMSRSVMVPTSRWLSQTGSEPTPRASIAAAACCSEASGATVSGLLVMTSETCMTMLMQEPITGCLTCQCRHHPGLRADAGREVGPAALGGEFLGGDGGGRVELVDRGVDPGGEPPALAAGVFGGGGRREGKPA